MRLTTLCGSLRARSSSRAILRAYERVMPTGVAVEHYAGLAGLPHFNPDLDIGDEALPREVLGLRRMIAAADAVAISTPEYAHALPGSLKNALDWLVGDPAFAGKPVAILQAARGTTWAVDSLREVLKTMSATVVDGASVALPLGSNLLDEEAILAHGELRRRLVESARALVATSAR